MTCGDRSLPRLSNFDEETKSFRFVRITNGLVVIITHNSHSASTGIVFDGSVSMNSIKSPITNKDNNNNKDRN